MKNRPILLVMLTLLMPLAMWGQKTLPYDYGFENNDLAEEEWTKLSSSSNTNIATVAKRTGDYGFRFYRSPDPQYLISPLMPSTTNGLSVAFFYKNTNSSYPKSFRVGYSTTGSGVSDFTFGDEITTTDNQWTLFSQTFSANTKYIAINYVFDDSYSNLYLDDFSFEAYSDYPQPKNLVVTTYTSNSATLDWTPRTGQDHWDIYYTTSSTAPDGGTTPSVSNTVTKPFTITGLTSSVTYHAYVRGNYNNGEHYSDWSNACNFEVGCYTPTIAESMATCNQAYFAWTPVGNETSWQVAFSDQQDFDPDAVTLETVTTHYFVKENLTTGVTYYARVRAVCGEGDYSEWSEEVSMTTECIAPTNLHESSVTPTTANLTWTQGSNESHWQISYSTTENFTPENGTLVTVNSKPYTVSGLTPNTQYYAYVRAVCGENIYSTWSDICAFMPKYELTVSDDETNYNSFVPFYGYFVSYVTKSQFIIPASYLTDLLYANINKLTFYAGVETANFGSATFDVLISELDDVTVFENSEFFDWSVMTSVYSGTLSISDNKMEIKLGDSPYQYMGGDLLIGFDLTNSGNGITAYWYGAATTGYSAYGGYEIPAYSSTNYSRQKFIPKTTFSYTPGTAPTCLKPKNLAVSNVGATSASLSWTNGDTETAWVLQYATDANFTQNVVSVNVTTNPYTLAGLTPETTYYARVKADCGSGDYSTWSNACSFTPSAIKTIVVNDGTQTSYFVPFYGYSANSQNLKSQSIIPASELTSVTDKQITKLTFHTDSYYSSASFPGGVFKVYLSPTEWTDFSSFTPVDWNTLTEVYSGNLTVSNNKMEIALATPYLYSGGNLLVGFEETTLSSSASFVEWLGMETDNYASYYNAGYDDREKFLPKITISYSILSCSLPTNLCVNATSSAATLTWTAGDEETAWNVQYKAASASDWSEVIVVEDTPTCTINGLSANTEYQVRIQANCGGSVSSWATESFATSCGSVGIPYSYDFSDVAIGQNTAFPQCWTRINNAENANYNYYPFVTATNKVLKFIASANTNAPTQQIAVMPEMTADINTLRMSFKAYLSSGNTNKTLSVGVMTDPHDASTFTKVVDVVVRNSNASTFYPISLEGYHGDGQYIAFKCDKLTSGSEYFIFIDDITVEAVPTVAPVSIPYSYNFDEATTGYNAFPPDGWHFSNTYYPYVYEGASMAQSGSNFLLMQKPSTESACYAVLPPINTTDNPINTLKLSFWARLWNSSYIQTYLSIGVMTDPSDINTYQFITSVSVRNAYSLYEIYFDDYVGEGQYIVLRSYNTDNYFCVDDIELSVAPTCRQPLDLSTQYTNSHEAYIRWKTRDLRQCNYQVSYSTDETFDPENGTIVDVEFENTLVNAGTDYRGYELTCLNANTTYYYYVRANCGNGDFSDWSDDYASLTTGEPCPAPYGFYANTVKNTYAELRWYGDVESSWDFQYKKTADDEWITATEMEFLNGEGSEIIFRLSGLESGTEYECRVREHCGMYTCPVVDDGYSDWATESFITGTGCAEPQPWMCLTQMGTSATLEWYQTGEETQWQIRYRLEEEWPYPEENIVLTDEKDEARKQRWTIEGLQPSSTYYWQVRAYCDSENQSEWSEESYFYTGGAKVTVDKTHPFYEDFEGDEMPDGFTRCNQYNYDLDYYMPWSYTPAEGPSWDERPGNHGIYNNHSDFHGSTSVILPEMHIDENSVSTMFSFWDYCDYGPSAISGQNISYGSMQIMASTTHGETYDYLWWSFGPHRYWHQHFVDLDEYIGQDVVLRIDYWYANNNPNFDWYIDDVKVQVFDNSFGSGSDVTSGDWNDPTMWGNGSAPGDDENVIINANVTIPDGVVAQANQIVINTDTINTGDRAQKFGKLIIADGGQLKVNNEVEATMLKVVSAYTSSRNGWYLLAPPVQETLDPKHVDGVVTTEGAYDLYAFDGSRQDEEWRNYKQEENAIVFNNGYGFLYANSLGGDLLFTGTVLPSNQTKAVDLSFATTTFGGWNLVGNPFTCDAYFQDGRDFYRMNEGGTALVLASGVIHPMEGVFVEADNEGQSVVFTITEPSRGQGVIFSLRKAELTREGALTGSTTLDRTRIRFGEGQNLGHLDLMADPNRLYFPMSGKDMAVVSSQPVGELPLNFEAAKDGTYTLSFEGATEGLLYCHLIDNMTGADVDLLASKAVIAGEDPQSPTASYTFSAKVDDYASRFKVVFVAKDEDGSLTGSETFAFNNNGNWIIANEGRATLQVIDLNGRILSSEQIEGSTETRIDAVPGLYLIRLINGENVKVQKVVVR